MLGIAGVTAIETNAAGVTVIMVEPLMAPDVAVTVVLPTTTLLTLPWASAVAIEASPVIEVTVVVTSCVLPSV